MGHWMWTCLPGHYTMDIFTWTLDNGHIYLDTRQWTYYLDMDKGHFIWKWTKDNWT
ncbi:hypothetical protein FH972_019212 [Carpinus fangiana]|uniref:Uncharacterized protein n=1 Tax=Carpinus fangiana TaxID=176857 RepID=A0A5N6RTM3_9ROSI|nr:hypothetical protein FH972_019212 [Carpinus fangiana]